MTAEEFTQFNQNIINSVSSLGFTIPTEIFSSLDILTHCVGYVMPLRLYSPIITLILSYWLTLIVASAFRGMTSFVGNMFSFIKKL